jgi:hypothetical protein
MVTIRIPALPAGLLSNLLGLAGLVAVVAAVGGLTHNWWWSALAAGVVAVVLSVIAQHNATTAGAGEGVDGPTAEYPRLAARSRSA